MSLAAPRGDSAEWVTVRHFSRRFRLALAGLCLGPLPAVADGKAGDCGGDAYTFAEYQKMYQNSGFAHNKMHRLEGSPQSVIVSRR